MSDFKKVFAGIAMLFCPFSFMVSSAAASSAILLGTTICDNQADAMDYVWKQANDPTVRLFFISGNNNANGQINPVGHAYAFELSDDVSINIHGNVGTVADFSGQDFARVFVRYHPTPPRVVTMYVCQSGTVPLGIGAMSSMASLARSYQGGAPAYTLVGAMNAPAPNECPYLRGRTVQNAPPVGSLAFAQYKTNVGHIQPNYDNLLYAMVNSWDGTTHYPGTVLSFKRYCQQQLANDPTGQWLTGFIQQVNLSFGVQYLNLVNFNYGGNNFAICGTNNNTPCN